MAYRKINYTPEALERRRSYAREYYRKKRDDPEYMEKRKAYDSIRTSLPHRKERAALWKAARPGYSKEQYHKDPERYREYARKARLKTVRVPRGKPGSARYEAIMAGFRSGFERTLDIQLKISGVKYSYESLQVPYTLSGNYHPDFVLENNIIIEAKGLLTTEDRRKMRAVKDQHPELDIRFVFMNAEKRIPHGKSTHAQWATRNGFQWADGTIPEEWLTEKRDA